MKRAVICKEVDEYTSKLLEQDNLTIIYADSMSLNELSILLSSSTIHDTPVIILFDLSLIKLKKEYIDLIENTSKDIILVTDDPKKIPTSLKKSFKVSNIIHKKQENVMDVMGKLGTEKLDLKTLKKYPLGQLIKYLATNWQKFDKNNDVYLMVEELCKKLYKVNDDYLYLYLLWGFPPQKRKSFFKYPKYKKQDTKDIILKKIGEYYGYSMNETRKMLWLIRRIINNEMADKYGFTDAERKLVGLKKKEKKTVKSINIKKILKSKSLLEI